MMASIVVLLLAAGDGFVYTSSEVVEGEYSVRFADKLTPQEVADAAAQFKLEYGGELVAVNPGIVPTASFTGWKDERIAQEVAYDERVDFVEANAVIHLCDTQQLRAILDRQPALDRLDQRENPADFRFRYPMDGTGIRIYVLDTGVSQNTSLGARLLVSEGFTVAVGGPPTTDTAGHGTAMATIAAGTEVGVAKNASVVPIKYGVGGSIPMTLTNLESALLVLIDENRPPGVLNLSAEWDTTAPVGSLIAEQRLAVLVSRGFVVVVSAGNDGRDINAGPFQVTPARLDDVVTVGGMDVSSHTRWVGPTHASNWGTSVDLFAPAPEVKAEAADDGHVYVPNVGTSQSTALVSGVLANLLQLDGSLEPAAAQQWLVDSATTGVLSGLNGSVNRLLFSDVGPSLVGSAAGIGPSGLVYCTFGAGAGWKHRTTSVVASTSDSNGNIYLAHRMVDPPLCFSANPLEQAAYTYLEKRSSSGASVWTNPVSTGLALTEDIHQLTVSSSGVIFGVGSTFDTQAPCGDEGTCSGVNQLIFSVSPSGSPLWKTRLGCYSTDLGRGIALVQEESSVLVVGMTTGSCADFNPGGYDLVARELASSTGIPRVGSFSQVAIAGNIIVNGLVLLQNNSFLVVGGVTGAIPDQISQGGEDAFIYGLEADTFNPNFSSHWQFGTAGDDELTAARSGSDVSGGGTVEPTVYAAGTTSGNFPGFLNAGGLDLFAIRLTNSINGVAWLIQDGSSADDRGARLALGPDDVFLAADARLTKLSRVSGMTAWTRVTESGNAAVESDGTRHISLFSRPSTSYSSSLRRYRAF